MSDERIHMTIDMWVSEGQALALQAMFEYWNELSTIGSSRYVGFYVDGDGDFHPNIQVHYDRKITRLDNDHKVLAITSDNDDGRMYDFDGVAWTLNKREEEKQASKVVSIWSRKKK